MEKRCFGMGIDLENKNIKSGEELTSKNLILANFDNLLKFDII